MYNMQNEAKNAIVIKYRERILEIILKKFSLIFINFYNII